MPPSRVARRLAARRLGSGLGMLLLAACGGSPAGPATPSTEERSAAPLAATSSMASRGAGRPVVTMWAPIHPKPEVVQYVRETVALAGKAGGFEVAVEFFRDDVLRAKEEQALAMGQPPDLAVSVTPTEWARRGWVREIDDLYHEIGRDSGGWYPVVDDLSVLDGRRIGLPVALDLDVLFLRQDLFAAAGFHLPFASFDELVAGLVKVTTSGRHGLGLSLTHQAWWPLLDVIFTHGGRLFARDGRPTIDTPRNRAGLAAYLDLTTTRAVLPPTALTWNWASAQRAYLGEAVAAIPCGIDLLQQLRTERPDLLAKTAVTAWPAAPGGQPAVAADGVLVVVNRQGPQVERALQVVRALLSRERYPGLLAAAEPAVLSPLRGYQDLPVFTGDAWSRQIQRDIVPVALPLTADTARTPVFDRLSTFLDIELRRAVAEGVPLPQVIGALDRRATEVAAEFGRQDGR